MNRFSLTWIHRNRLARTFLGSARTERRPDAFTRFDPEDNCRLHQLTPRTGEGAMLYPVFNATLNATASEAVPGGVAPFIFSPLYCGSAMLTAEGREAVPASGDRVLGTYVPSTVYAHEPDLALPGAGLTLATAMTVSGAAADRSSGYHASPLTALLMTLFSVRLGAWLPNPARADALGDALHRSAPADALRPLLRGLVGATSDRGHDIFLSDGGHFDNLGLYEMIRRRCRFILLCDAGADPDCGFTDLGNAVRKVKIDFDVDIGFEELRISGRGTDIDPQFAYALGTIEYPEARPRGQEPEHPAARAARTGRLLYIKPSYFGELPVDLRAYAAESPAFPHESAGDQFFSEAQFESYRCLGDFFASALEEDPARTDLAAFFAALEARQERMKQAAAV